MGLFIALVMLNIGEGVIEAFVKPYMASHGGIPSDTPAGFGVFEAIALLGIAIIAMGAYAIRTVSVDAPVPASALA